MFGWVKDHWKTIATVAVATVVFVGVTALTGGLGAPAMVALMAGGFASGAAGSALSNYLDGKPVSVKEALVQGTVAAVVTVATAGIGRVVAPVIGRAVAPVASRVLPEAAVPFVTRTVANTTVGATLGAGTQVAQNALTGRPLDENVGQAALLSGASGALLEPLQRLVPKGVNNNPRLVHLTTEGGESGIRSSGQVNGSKGIFALPESAASQPTAVKVLRTGLTPNKTTNFVPLPEAANAAFKPVTPIGPYSLLKALGGVRYAPAGSIDIATGAFKPAPGGLIGPRTLIYGPDILAYGTAAVSAALGEVVRSLDAPAPSQQKTPAPAKSVGMTNALGGASK